MREAEKGRETETERAKEREKEEESDRQAHVRGGRTLQEIDRVEGVAAVRMTVCLCLRAPRDFSCDYYFVWRLLYQTYGGRYVCK